MIKKINIQFEVKIRILFEHSSFDEYLKGNKRSTSYEKKNNIVSHIETRHPENPLRFDILYIRDHYYI